MAACAESTKESQQRCCFKSCIQEPESKMIAVDCRKVVVKSFEPKKKKDKLLVNWEMDGSAQFHSQCWDNLVKVTKSDGSLYTEITDIERSMILEAKKTAEFYDADCVISKEAVQIASILKSSNHCIAFTGAGISTAAGIGDFRGLDGKWTKRDREKNYGAPTSKPSNRATIMEKLRPTYTHEALHKLLEMGYLKFIISQNVDGLHRLSGVPKENISELHGNAFTERCEECGTVYELQHHYRHGETTVSSTSKKKCSRCKISHQTGRKCLKQGCSGHLMNTIINFGDYLESEVLGMAQYQAKKSDAVLILGSSLKVSPANDLVMMGEEPHRLIICNRQTTPYDSECKLQGKDGKQLGARVFCDCDKLMKNIMEQVLPPIDLQKWEKDRNTRMAEYKMKRISI